MKEPKQNENLDWLTGSYVFNELTGESDQTMIYFLHDKEFPDPETIGFARKNNDSEVLIVKRGGDHFDHPVIGTIQPSEISHVVKFLENYKVKDNPATINEELILLRKMALYLQELNDWLERPDKSEVNWRKQGYISKAVPGVPLAHAGKYLSLEYYRRFGKPEL